MARKLIEFPLFDLKEIYKEIREKGITPFKWVTEEIERTFPEELIKELKPIKEKLLPPPKEELPPEEELLLPKPEKTTRTLTAEVEISCCKSGEVQYPPEPRPFEVSETKVFMDTLEEWKEKRGKQLEEQAKEYGEDECKGMSGSLRLCNFRFIITDYKEEE